MLCSSSFQSDRAQLDLETGRPVSRVDSGEAGLLTGVTSEACRRFPGDFDHVNRNGAVELAEGTDRGSARRGAESNGVTQERSWFGGGLTAVDQRTNRRGFRVNLANATRVN